MTTSQYRLLLIASIVTGIVGGAVDFVFPQLLPEGLLELQNAHDEALSTSRLLLASLLGIAGFVFYVASVYGLFRFRPWAPRLSIFGTALLLCAVPFLGAMAQSGLATSISYLASYLWGAVMVLANTASASAHFKPDNA